MTLINWTPKRDMLNFFDDMGRMFNHTISYPLESEHESYAFSPCMNVNESESEYTVIMDLPGVEKRDVAVNVREGMVTVLGKRNNSQKGKDNNCVLQETSSGTFHRSFELSNAVQEDRIKARYRNGVLHLTIPKAKENKPTVKQIPVN